MVVPNIINRGVAKKIENTRIAVFSTIGIYNNTIYLWEVCVMVWISEIAGLQKEIGMKGIHIAEQINHSSVAGIHTRTKCKHVISGCINQRSSFEMSFNDILNRINPNPVIINSGIMQSSDVDDYSCVEQCPDGVGKTNRIRKSDIVIYFHNNISRLICSDINTGRGFCQCSNNRTIV